MDKIDVKSTVQASARSLLSLSSGVELSTSISFNGIFLYPKIDGDRGSEGEDGVGGGTACTIVSIVVAVASDAQAPEPIASLTAELVGYEDLACSSAPTEHNVISYATGEAKGASSLQLKPGHTYRWDVSLQVSHNATPYERTRHGRVYQSIIVRLKWADDRLLKKYKNLEVKRRIWLISIPHHTDNFTYSRNHQTAADHLGPIAIYLRTPNLTVGGHLRLGVSLICLDPICRLKALEVNIVQKVTLKSRQRSHYVESFPVERTNVLLVEGDQLLSHLNESKDSLEGHWIARLKSEDSLRPSTLPGSQVCIAVSTSIELRLLYYPNGELNNKPTMYTAAWPVTLASCVCRPQSIRLPLYSQQDPTPIHRGMNDDEPPPDAFLGDYIKAPVDNTSFCACRVSTEELLDHDDDYKKTLGWSVARHIQHEGHTDLRSGVENDHRASQQHSDQQEDQRRQQKAQQSYMPI